MSKNTSRRKFAGGRRRFAGLLVFALAALIGVGAYAFTAGNTVAPHSAGAGAATVSGYVVESPTNYTFSGDGLTMVGVKFKLNKPASDVQVALTPGTPETKNWSDCGASVAEEVTCTFATPVPDEEGLKLSVAAVSSGTVTIE